MVRSPSLSSTIVSRKVAVATRALEPPCPVNVMTCSPIDAHDLGTGFAMPAAAPRASISGIGDPVSADRDSHELVGRESGPDRLDSTTQRCRTVQPVSDGERDQRGHDDARNCDGDTDRPTPGALLTRHAHIVATPSQADAGRHSTDHDSTMDRRTEHVVLTDSEVPP
jgi:hypothetical protein